MPIVYVTAAQDRQVPQEHHSRRYYPSFGAEPMPVTRTPYLARLIQQGDLIVIEMRAASEDHP